MLRRKAFTFILVSEVAKIWFHFFRPIVFDIQLRHRLRLLCEAGWILIKFHTFSSDMDPPRPSKYHQRVLESVNDRLPSGLFALQQLIEVQGERRFAAVNAPGREAELVETRAAPRLEDLQAPRGEFTDQQRSLHTRDVQSTSTGKEFPNQGESFQHCIVECSILVICLLISLVLD